MIYSPASPAPHGFLWGEGEGRAGLWFYSPPSAFVAVLSSLEPASSG